MKLSLVFLAAFAAAATAAPIEAGQTVKYYFGSR